MNVSEIATLITNVGFPITCTIVLFIQNNSFQKTLSDINVSLQKLSDRIDSKEVK